MAQVTSVIDATPAWVQIANATQKFFVTISTADAVVLLRYSNGAPTASAIGHPLRAGDTFGDTPTENVWIRASQGAAQVVLTKD